MLYIEQAMFTFVKTWVYQEQQQQQLKSLVEVHFEKKKDNLKGLNELL